MGTTSIEIGSGTWTIDVVPADHPELIRGSAWGIAVPAAKSILISEDLGEDTYYQVLLHELLHAVSIESVVGYFDDLSEEAHHDLDRLAKGLYGMMKANGWKIPKELRRGE